MAKIPATEFKARCLELMDRVADRRETYVITKRGKPVAKLVPVEKAREEPLFGRLRDMVEQVGDIVAPAAAANEWDVLREWNELNVPAPAPAKRRRARRRS